MSEDQVREAIRQTGDSCLALGSKFTARLCNIMASRLSRDNAVGAAVLNWQGDASNSGDVLAMRLAGALHAIVLVGMDEDLARIYPPNPMQVDDDDFWKIIASSMTTHSENIIERLQFAPQTNEVRRSVAIYAGLMALTREYEMPLVLSELGASAGLNLLCDQYEYQFASTRCGKSNSSVLLSPQLLGEIPDIANVQISERQGCDLNPLDIASDDDMNRLRSYLWPDQIERIERTGNAIDIGRSMFTRELVEKCDACKWLSKRLEQKHDGHVHVIFHSIAWQYFPANIQERCQKLIQDAGEYTQSNAPIAWLAIEADGGKGAAIRLKTWPGNMVKSLGRMDFHGRWLDWNVQ